MNIADVDKNFVINDDIKRDGIVFENIQNKNLFTINGVFKEGNSYVRMPQAVAETVNSGVAVNNRHSVGGRIRFKCDSPYIAVALELNYPGKMSHCAYTGCIGCDLYMRENGKELHFNTVAPETNVGTRVQNIFGTDGKMHEYTVNLPTYSSVKEVFIGFKDGSHFEKPHEYKYSKPVVFYGSSITQGGCASRPGNNYSAILSRMFDFDYINLGYSGSARGEDEIADYIAGLDMSVFVYDYDHNAPTAEHLAATHERMFLRIREKQPDLPVIMMTRPSFRLSDNEKERLEIIRGTYENAKAAGDNNVYFVPGYELIPEELNEIARVDLWHPNDAGFYFMAKGLEPVMKKIFEKL